MDPYYKKNKKKVTKEAIIGLGEDSFRKNYYAELQEKITELEKVNVRNKTLIKTIPDMLFVANASGMIIPFSFSSTVLKPYTSEIIKNRNIIRLLQKEITQTVSSKETRSVIFDLEINQRTIYFEARMNVSELQEILIIIRDVTEQKELEQKLRYMAERDGLTGLYNRFSYEEKVKEFENQSVEMVSLILFDIDGLKVINDTLGNAVGDKLLRHVSAVLSEVYTEDCFVARIGGDELAVLCKGYTESQTEDSFVQLQQRLSDAQAFNDIFSISLSFGYAYHRQGIFSHSLLFQQADNNLHQNKMLKESSNKNQLVKTLMKALEAKDYITEGHADRMETNALLLAKRLKLNQAMIDRIHLLTKFHDIGKVGIPDSILKKPGSLTPEEWEIMKTHCAIGERIANESSELREISYLILTHQEKWDGTGYPLGLRGEEIPIESRILALADAYDAMTNDRPYRKGLTKEQAREEIITNKGTQFDPGLVEVFLSIIDNT